MLRTNADFIKQHPAGQQTLSRSNSLSHAPQQRTPALVLHQAGTLRVYGPASLDPIFLNLPRVDSVQGELGLEKLMDAILPWAAKDIFWPGNLRGGGRVLDLNLLQLGERIEEVRVGSELFSKSPLFGRRLILEAMRA